VWLEREGLQFQVFILLQRGSVSYMQDVLGISTRYYLSVLNQLPASLVGCQVGSHLYPIYSVFLIFLV
jgi:hypothetical protein